MPATVKETTTKFDKPEAIFPVKCDVHPWMNAYVGVFNHPFFSVTGTDGKFTISGLDPGTYEITAWHERLGTQTATVTVGGQRHQDPELQVRRPRREVARSGDEQPHESAESRRRTRRARRARGPSRGARLLAQYVFSADHKVIGIQYAVTGLLFLFFGFSLVMLMRWQLAYPGAALPLIGRLFGEARMPGGTMLPEFYNELGAMHGTIMVFLGVVPLAVGGFGNFVLPLQIGAPDMAFPRINMASYWSYFLGGVTMLASFFVPGGAAQSGWTSYAPLSVLAGTGQTVWLIGMIFLITSSLLGAVNFITTTIQLRAKGLTFMRFPFFVWAQFVTAVPSAARLPAARGRGGHAADGSGGRHELLPAERPGGQRPGPHVRRRRQPAPLAAPVLVPGPPGGLRPDPARRWASSPRSSPTTRGSRCGATARWSTRWSSSASCRSSSGRTTCS